jgi:hypothetical protein
MHVGSQAGNSMKHLQVFFVKDYVTAGEKKIEDVNTKDMIVDLLTKPLQGEQFQLLRDKLLGHIPSPIVTAPRSSSEDATTATIAD